MRMMVFLFNLCLILFVLAACASQPVPAAIPSATTVPPTPTSISSTSTPAFPQEIISDLDKKLTNLAAQGLFTGSVLIGRQGSVLLSKGYGLADREKNIPNTSQTRFRIGSLTKQFTAMAILILESQGKLKVTDPICNYLSECPDAWKAITIQHLLTHTSGIPNYTVLPGYLEARSTPATPEQMIDRFRNLPLDFQPGESLRYSNSGYTLLGSIIERVSGKSYEDFLQEAIFLPLKLSNTGYDHNSDTLAVGYADGYSVLPAHYIDMSIPYAAGALYSTVEDLYAWNQSLYTEQLVPQKYLDEMFAPQVKIGEAGEYAYGYGWVMGKERGHAFVAHTGSIEGFSSIIMHYPEEQVTIIILSNQNNNDVELINEIISKKILGDE